MKKERQSNLELLRMLCMFTIVLGHFIMQSGIYKTDTLYNSIFYNFTTCFTRISVNIFFIISFWFLNEQKFKSKRLLNVWISTFLYTVPISIILKYMFFYDIPIVNAFFPIVKQPLWFVGVYFVMVLASPFLNCMIATYSQKAIQFTLLIYGIIIIIIPTCFKCFYHMTDYGAYPIYLYILIGYLKKYPIRILNNRLVSFVLGSISYIFIVGGTSLSMYKYSEGNIFVDYFLFFKNNIYSLPNIMCALCFFFLFLNISIRKNNFINGLAKCMFGVYILHACSIWFNYLWKIFRPEIYGNTKYQYIYVFLVTIVVIIGFSLIDYLRNKYIIDRIMNSNIVNKITTKIDSWFSVNKTL